MELEQEIEVEKKVDILKQRLQEVINTHCYEIYALIKEILELRQTQITGYDIKDIHREKGIDLTDDQVRYYMSFDYISPKSERLISQGKLKGSTFLFIMRKSTEFREHKLQDSIFSRYLKGEINSTTISYTPIDQIITGAVDAKSSVKAYKMYYKLKEMRRAISATPEIIEDEDARRLLLAEVSKINKLIKRNGKKAPWAFMFTKNE